MAQEAFSTVIFGCGNQIMGDDGFGPAVIAALQSSYSLPADITAIDVGTAIREYLFDYLLSAEGRPERIIILDAVDQKGRYPGDVFQIRPSAISAKKVHDFSLHQFPTVNLLAELEEHTDIEVIILAAQVEFIPGEIEPGLSIKMREAIPVACEKILEILTVNSKSR